MFEKYDERNVTKWADVDENVCYNIVGYKNIPDASRYGDSHILELENADVDLFRVYIPERMARDFLKYEKDVGRRFDWVMSKGKKSIEKMDKDGNMVPTKEFWDYQFLDSKLVREREREEKKRKMAKRF